MSFVKCFIVLNNQEIMFRNVIVIGASAGGFAPVRQMISQLPGTIDAAVFVVLHMSRNSNALTIARLWQKRTELICNVPSSGDKILKGHIYIAPANHHMLISDGSITINDGPSENKYRPSIDVLFRSAAVHFGTRVIGIIVSGVLDDGTSGMWAIKKCGGICIVQDPDEAEFRDMPQNVINKIDVDYKSDINEISYVISDILSKPLPVKVPVPEELLIESEIAEKMSSSIDQMNRIAEKSDFTCPDCNGRLWIMKGDPVHRYRCHTGHVYNERTLLELQRTEIEKSIWVSIRMLEERCNLLNLSAHNAEDSGNLTLPKKTDDA
jgi:two-component system, chemotaxis family, protein-glutamate methylesterase/glutaminase